MMTSLVTLISGRSFPAPGGSTILDSATQCHISLPYSCKSGRCSTCKCKVRSGETKAIISELGLSELDKADGWILSCARTVMSDVVLEVEDLGVIDIPEAKTLACRISSLQKLAPDVIKVILRLPPNVKFRFIPGQYIDVIGPGGIRRSYSIANAPKSDNQLEMHIRAVENGAMSDYWFKHAAVNDLLRLHGPQGTFFLRKIAQRDLVFFATGTGIAPVKAMLEALLDTPQDQAPRSVTVLWGVRNLHDFYLDTSALPGNFKFIPVLSRSGFGQVGYEHGYVQDIFLKQKPDLLNSLVYACGSEAMIKSAKFALAQNGFLDHHFFSDAFVCSDTLALQ
jgi:CDP-4-dehydro-6-deoxyglucose reductase, E3